MKKSIIILLTLIITSCQFLKENEKIETSINKVSNEINCPIKFINEVENETKNIQFTFQCVNQNELFPGLVIEMLINQLNADSIFHDIYSINHEMERILTIDKSDINNILNKKSLFLSLDAKIKTRAFEQVYSELDESFKSNIDITNFNDICESIQSSSYSSHSKYDGFAIASENGLNYILYQVGYEDGKKLWMSFNLDSKNDNILGFGFE